MPNGLDMSAMHVKGQEYSTFGYMQAYFNWLTTISSFTYEGIIRECYGALC